MTDVSFPPSTYLIRSRLTNACLTHKGPGDLVRLEPCANPNLPLQYQQQLWIRSPAAYKNSWQSVALPGEGKRPHCLDVYDPDDPELRSWSCNNNPNQTSIRYDDGSSQFTYTHPETKRVWTLGVHRGIGSPLGSPSWRRRNGITTSSSSPDVQWELIAARSKVSPPPSPVTTTTATESKQPVATPPLIKKPKQTERKYQFPSAWNALKPQISRRELNESYVKFIDHHAQQSSPTLLPEDLLSAPPNQVLIISTYNVHYWTNVDEEWKFDEIKNDIEELNASILLLQEVSVGCNFMCKEYYQKQPFRPSHLADAVGRSGVAGSYQRFWNYLSEKIGDYPGYDQVEFCETARFYGQPFGNLIMVRRPYRIIGKKSTFLPVPETHPDEKRCVTRIVIQLPDGKDTSRISVYNVHLDVWDETERTRVKELKTIFDDLVSKDPYPVIIGGDFNSVLARDYPAAVWQWMKRNDEARGSPVRTDALDYVRGGTTPLFKTSFELARQPQPPLTVWSNRTVDFLLFDRKWWMSKQGLDEAVLDSWPSWTPHSDHIPISVALDVPLLQQKLARH